MGRLLTLLMSDFGFLNQVGMVGDAQVSSGGSLPIPVAEGVLRLTFSRLPK